MITVNENKKARLWHKSINYILFTLLGNSSQSISITRMVIPKIIRLALIL